MVQTWKENHLIYIVKKVIPYVTFIFLLYIFLFFQNKKYKEKDNLKNGFNNYSLFSIFLFTAICCILWFLKFPLYRFGLSFIYSLILLIFVLSTRNLIKSVTIKKIRFLSFLLIFISLIGFSTKNLNRIIKERNLNSIKAWPEVLASQKFKKIVVNNDGYYFFSNGKQCMYGTSPCTYYKPNNLNFYSIYNYKIFWIEE